MAEIPSVNSLRVNDGLRVIRSKCSKCGHFIAETPLDRDLNTNTLHFCPSCKNMVRVAVRYIRRCY